MRFRLSLAAGLLAAASMRGITVVTVTNTSNAGVGSLRDAITSANIDHTITDILFSIPSSDPNCDAGGVCTISPLTNFDTITHAVTIDGYSQTGAQPNTLDVGTNAVLKIVLSGASNTDPNPTGLDVAADNVVVKGLAVGGFQYGIRFSFSSGGELRGSFIGTDVTGHTAVPNEWGMSGLIADVVIGGPDGPDWNVISGNTTAGINLDGCANTLIQGNLIGTTASGLGALGNGAGIFATGASSGLVIGGSTPGAANVVSANLANGIYMSLGPSTGVIVHGNKVGTDATGTAPLGNALAGIRVASPGIQIGGIGPGEGNIVGFNVVKGIGVDTSGYGVSIRGNSVFENGYGPTGYHVGIDLEPSQATTANDEGDGDTGSNGLQNFPIVSSAEPVAGGGTEVQGVLHSSANGEFDLDFYENEACVPLSHNFLQGWSYIGSTHVTTDMNGTAQFDATLAATIAAGAHVTATATDADGNTSEFSQRMPFSTSVNSGPASGGSPIGVGGTDFLPGATLTIGGAAASDVNVVSFNYLTATLPALSPGTLNDVVVTDPDGASGVLEGGYVADFADVPGSHPFYQYVTNLVLERITAGIGGGNYGPTMNVLRQQMAVFLLKSKLGYCYQPAPCTKQVFDDVDCSSPFAPWINELVAEGITAGCGGGNYCPLSAVTRQQMAVFLLKAFEGASYVPPDCTKQSFDDVPCDSPYAPWIYELVARNITGGCGNNDYCPASDTTRGQMAVFIGLTFEF